ncbi:3' terminal RNA ribose 2'-O-methyltransferase Hen1 [Desulfosporosinus sp. PR]|uniref:3' terminal RNA ribose 2'-O-methyltransferase Hen1 n=1 Tax=Candidatus Desulfosporosinus nitrosoreducens TaxID=3401928 RepID=UPI0027FD9B57|nr:3' terminal RNA ribose 2'-O-methyltransferase Hen1 [Desulfosporosinus sp. PR]MDQ7095447.1 3' terminal RNA ribose 2'-O-methyltransferase Hen1 [Desulfosporosinus sp. PR]
MQLALKATGEGAKMLSFLLSKNPQNLYDRMEKGHRVRFTYTVFSECEVEAVIFVTPDPVELVKNSPDTYEITQYINDREFVVSSIFCSQIRSALGTALNGRPKEEYLEWAKHAFDLTVGFGPVATDLPDAALKRMFEPLGYQIEIERGQASYHFQLKERSSARFIHLQGKETVQNALKHLFVLIPVLDNYRHYFIDEREIEKLERYGEGWLGGHPLKELIIQRTLRFRDLIERMEGHLVQSNHLDQLDNPDNPVQTEGDHEALTPEPTLSPQPVVRLNELRYQRVVKLVQSLPAKERIVDFGAGEGKLSVRLGFIPGVKEILAVEPTEKEQLRALKRFSEAGRKEGFMAPTPLWGSLFYFDEQLCAKDVMILNEVIEHIDEDRLPRVMDTILGGYKPKVLIITTPNAEYNAVYQMENQEFRHKDHRFEWSRAKFAEWAHALAEHYSYKVRLEGIGAEAEGYGHPSQIAIFSEQGGMKNE